MLSVVQHLALRGFTKCAPRFSFMQMLIMQMLNKPREVILFDEFPDPDTPMSSDGETLTRY